MRAFTQPLARARFVDSNRLLEILEMNVGDLELGAAAYRFLSSPTLIGIPVEFTLAVRRLVHGDQPIDVRID